MPVTLRTALTTPPWGFGFRSMMDFDQDFAFIKLLEM